MTDLVQPGAFPAPASAPSSSLDSGPALPIAQQPLAPAYDLADTTLVLASEAQQRIWGDRAVRQWSMPRGWSYERSLDISRQCEKLVGGEEGRRLVWALVPRDNPHGEEVLSATRTFKRDAKIMRAGSSEVQHVTSYVITGVITPAEYRKRGYARHMLRLLHYCISLPSTLPPFPAAWGAPPRAGPNDATFSTLWSAVGPDFYRKAMIGDGEGARDGWTMCYDQEVVLDVGKGSEGVQRGALDELARAGWTIQEGLPSGPPAATAAHEAQLLEANLSDATTITALDSLSSPGQLPWNMLKCALGMPPDRSVANDARGAISADGSSWIYWACQVAANKPTTLCVVHAHLAPGDMPRVLDALMEHGRNMHAKTISAFEVEESLLPAWKERGARLVKRDDHLGAMAWYGEEPAAQVKAVAGQ